VCLHCENRPNNTYFIHGKQSKYYHAHVSNTTISYQFFQIYLSQCCQTPINYSNQTNSTYPRPQISTGFGEQILIKSQLSIGSQFQQNPCQQHTSSCTPFNVCFRQPQMQRHHWHFHCKSLKKAPPQ
jgi:hypothetical protein